MENQIAKLDVEFELFTNGNLCLLAHCADRTSTQCIALDANEPFSFLAIVSDKDGSKAHGSAERPASIKDERDKDASDAHGSAEQPVLNKRPAVSLKPAPPHGSAEQPVVNKRPAFSLQPATPLYDKLITCLEQVSEQHPQGSAFVDYITKSCFFGQLLTKDFFGQTLEKTLPLAIKMERLLQEAQRQRQLHFDTLQESLGRGLFSPGSAEQPALCHCHTHMRMQEDDMKKIYNRWRAQPEEWMQGSTLEIYTQLLREEKNQKAHQLAKSRFSTFIFHLSGCKFLLHKLIELPLVSLSFHWPKQADTDRAVQPVDHPIATVLMDLISSYEEHKNTPEYKEAVRRSEKQQQDQKRLSHKLWWAQYR